MKGFIDDNLIQAINIENFNDGDIVSYCSNCGNPNGICKIIVGKKYACKVGCKCSLEKLEKQKFQENLMERQSVIKKYFSDISDNQNYKACTFENWNFNRLGKEYFDIFHTYANNFNENLKNNIGIFVEGKPGNGKTFASACVVNEIAKHDYIGLIIQIPKLIEKSESYKYEGITPSMIFKKLRYADLVVLDDFGVEKKFDKEKIYGIINEIYMSKKPIILTTNLTIEEVKSYHSRIRSRLNSMTPIVVNIKENNLRMEEGKAKKSFFNNLLNRFTRGSDK